MPLPDERNQAPKEGMSTGAKVALGCAIAAAVFVVLMIVGIVVIALNVKRIASYAASKGADAVINASTLSDAEKQDARVTVREFLDGDCLGNDDIAHLLLARLRLAGKL